MFFNIFQYIALLLTILVLIASRNGLLRKDEVNPLGRVKSELTVQEQWTSYGVLVGISLMLMLIISRFSLGSPLAMLLAVGVNAILSFFTLITFQAFLTTIREQTKLSVTRLFHNQNFLLASYLIVLIELGFLNWLKDVSYDVLYQFFFFVVIYSLLIMAIGIFLGMPRVEGEEQRNFPTPWKERLMIILDPLMVVFSASLMVKIVIDIISWLGSKGG